MSKARLSLMAFLYYLALVLLLHDHLPICNGLFSVDLDSLKHAEIDDVVTKRVCNESIGKCLKEAEISMDSESNRRVLAMQKKYISYGTLRRDMVPCDRPGASYYNCHARPANPYRRGCEVITSCARGTQGTNT